MAIILALFLQLSSWQWHRYHEKLSLQKNYQAASSAAEIPYPQALQRIKMAPKAPVFIAVTLSGHYDNDHPIVLDNRSLHGQAGYEIFTPLRIDQAPATAILIDRGFVPSGHHWQSLPDLTVTTATVQLRGFLTAPPTTFSLGPAIEPTTPTWPLRAARIDMQALQSHYPYTLSPHVLLLKPAQPGAFACEWSYPQFFAERSLGYTFQWLALALATLVLWAIMSFKKSNH